MNMSQKAVHNQQGKTINRRNYMQVKKRKTTLYSFKLFLYIVPFLILCFAFSYFPLHGWVYSFYDYKPPLKLSQCDFVGFQWFRMLFGNKTQTAQLMQVMKNTFAMSLLGIATSILPVGFAIFLNEIKSKRFRNGIICKSKCS